MKQLINDLWDEEANRFLEREKKFELARTERKKKEN